MTTRQMNIKNNPSLDVDWSSTSHVEHLNRKRKFPRTAPSIDCTIKFEVLKKNRTAGHQLN